MASRKVRVEDEAPFFTYLGIVQALQLCATMVSTAASEMLADTAHELERAKETHPDAFCSVDGKMMLETIHAELARRRARRRKR